MPSGNSALSCTSPASRPTFPVITRSEATKQSPARDAWTERPFAGDCFVASLLAMTGGVTPRTDRSHFHPGWVGRTAGVELAMPCPGFQSARPRSGAISGRLRRVAATNRRSGDNEQSARKIHRRSAEGAKKTRWRFAQPMLPGVLCTSAVNLSCEPPGCVEAWERSLC